MLTNQLIGKEEIGQGLANSINIKNSETYIKAYYKVYGLANFVVLEPLDSVKWIYSFTITKCTKICKKLDDKLLLIR